MNEENGRESEIAVYSKVLVWKGGVKFVFVRMQSELNLQIKGGLRSRQSEVTSTLQLFSRVGSAVAYGVAMLMKLLVGMWWNICTLLAYAVPVFVYK